ncbi:hypothetical protein RJT34_26440 [Clitoria ternatea]|uniref:Uncharacterized protein n=1 Tax=Clitoria ternatea TaxID=43366 RepID=A0AAN9F8X0_CLITE
MCLSSAIDLNLTNATLLSNRSLCWIRLDQAEYALADAKACKALRPDWPKAGYREGAILRVLQTCYLEPSGCDICIRVYDSHF